MRECMNDNDLRRSSHLFPLSKENAKVLTFRGLTKFIFIRIVNQRCNS